LTSDRRLTRPLILAYHGVSASWRSPLAIPERLLAHHLSVLRSRGYVGFTFAESERRRTAGTLPKRSVVITFDDGFTSTLRAKTLLDEAGFVATVFVVTDFVDSGEPLCWPGVEQWLAGKTRGEMAPLGWKQLESLLEAGWEIGSHTATHAFLPRLDREKLARELAGSRRAIERRLGPAETVAYPYGLADARVAAAAREAGYLAGCTLTPALTIDERYRRPRIGFGPADRGWRARAKLSPTVVRLRRTRLAQTLEPLHFRGERLPPQFAPPDPG
jgi:peptidoglycan/xylan/chitin deacetylase (PgdA/CDA1 family)